MHTTPEEPAYKGNPRLRAVRIEVGQDVRDYTTGSQRVTVVPLTIRRKQNRMVLTPTPNGVSSMKSGGMDVSMIKQPSTPTRTS